MCIRNDIGYVNISNEAVYDASSIQQIRTRQSIVKTTAIQSVRNSAVMRNNSVSTVDLDTNNNETVYVVGETYFAGLTQYGDNTDGTCLSIASAILLGYLDSHIDERYVDNNSYRDGNGTNEAFHQHINDYVYGYHPHVPTTSAQAANALNHYLYDRGINKATRVTYNQAAVLMRLQNSFSRGEESYPVVVGFEILGSSIGHAMVAYKLTYNAAGEATVMGHAGWPPESQTLIEQNICRFEVSASYIYIYIYI